MYYSASTIRQGVKANPDAKVLKAKLALNWTGLYKTLADLLRDQWGISPFDHVQTVNQ